MSLKLKKIFFLIKMLIENKHIQYFNQNEIIEQLGGDLDGGEKLGQVSLSSDGTILAIGVIGVFGSPTITRVYKWNDTLETPAWEQLGEDIEGENASDESGTSVSLSSDGTTLAIGAIKNDGNGNNSGHVRVYNWNDTLEAPAWEQLGEDIDGEAAGDESGWSVSLSKVVLTDGTTQIRLAIGARNNDGNGDNSGHVRVYEYRAVEEADKKYWVQLGGDIDGEAAYDHSGHSVSLSSDGTTLAIGAIGNDGITENEDDNRGHVRVYKWNDTTSMWEQLGTDIDGENGRPALDPFGRWVVDSASSGWSVSLSSDGTILAIGAPHKGVWRSNWMRNPGYVRVYKWNATNSREQLGTDIDGENASDESGTSVSLSSDGTILAIVTPGRTPPPSGGDEASDEASPQCYYRNGHVRLYKWNATNSTWEQLGTDIDFKNDNLESSVSVSLSKVDLTDGTTQIRLAIGSIKNDCYGTGHVRVYEYRTVTAADITFKNCIIDNIATNSNYTCEDCIIDNITTDNTQKIQTIKFINCIYKQSPDVPSYVELIQNKLIPGTLPSPYTGSVTTNSKLSGTYNIGNNNYVIFR